MVVVTVPWLAYFARELAVVVPEIVVPEAEYEHKRNAKAALVLRDVERAAQAFAVKKLHRGHSHPYRAILDVRNRSAATSLSWRPIMRADWWAPCSAAKR